MRQIAATFLSLVVFAIFLLTGGCKKNESLTHITDFEMKVFTAVNNYRVSKTLEKITIHYPMAGDAQAHSIKMANGSVPYGINSGDEVLINLNTWKTNLNGDASGAVVQYSESENADTILNRMIRDPLKKQVLEGNFNLTGVGSAKDATSGRWYVTQLFIHIPQK
jgi:uncharacterized protein YkwD